jgi:hypothetical protein
MKEFLKKASKPGPKKGEITLSVFQKFNWKNMFENKFGCEAIYRTTERKNKPTLVIIDKAYDNHVILKTNVYDSEGVLRDVTNISVSYPSLICRDASIKFVNE